MIWGVEDLWQDAFSSIRLQFHAHIKRGFLWSPFLLKHSV